MNGQRRRPYNIILCSGPTCLKSGEKLVDRVKNEIEKLGLAEKVEVIVSGCLGMCKSGPVMIINPGYTLYGNVLEDDVAQIIKSHLIKQSPFAQKVIHEDHLFNRFFRIFGDVKFFGKQMRIALRNCGIIDPECLDDYLSVRGYEALAKVLQDFTPAQVIEEVTKAGLRGRGGAGFSTGLKWRLTREALADEKYVICNADEGDPGAFMDRSAIEGDPHTVLEGMIIGGYAIGARKGFVYIRAEYPLAIERLKKAIAAAREQGFIGEHIMETEFNFDIEIRLGAGAFVCGEETALIQSIEGSRGMPTPRPPYPSVRGLFDKPTLINNVETWANIPVIILDGSHWFSSIGTEKSKGTKVFAVAGNVVNTGLVEVPMGTTLREIIFDICGGIPENRSFKAVQTGGPSGGCLTEAHLDTQIDYESLSRAGSFMGSGGMIVMDETTCMVNVARFFLEFTQNESCGKCTPCREGTKRMLEILTRITEGKGELADIEKLQRLGKMISKASLCGLGRSAPSPLLSTLSNFQHEYEEHITARLCRAGVCTAMLRYIINEKCIGCTVCVRSCPVTAITGIKRNKHVIDQELCIKCGDCMKVCKFAAIDHF
jgi:NADH:ubiquinone oxidoreductase subunit F (NADH-binding)/(2Fe-2S) ferredoxin/NAD-dependent dihydropyrimidine dehydrogenase PreA subunit